MINILIALVKNSSVAGAFHRVGPLNTVRAGMMSSRNSSLWSLPKMTATSACAAS
ncbi:hypothetical protein D3C86_2257180 [compost metagenome]